MESSAVTEIANPLRGRHLVVVTQRYPMPVYPAGGVFVQELVRALCVMGVHCSVIHPVSLLSNRLRSLPPKITHEDWGGPQRVKVIRPRVMTYSGRQVFTYNTFRLTYRSFLGGVRRAVRYLERPAELYYGHFLYAAGAAAVTMGHSAGVPSFAAAGESTLGLVERYGVERARATYRHVTAVVANSSRNKRLVAERLGVAADKIAVLPNGVDATRFYPRDRLEMRRKHSLPEDRFIVAFVGHFDDRKGSRRVDKALDGLDSVGAIYLGQGAMCPQAGNTLFAGSVPHDQIPELLSAADAFVLPTLAEGCCNAIVEAMACGLPVISSDREFNDDLIDDATSIRIDPLDMGAIRRAVVALRDDTALRQRLADASLARAAELDINARARRIASWLQYHLDSSSVSPSRKTG